MRRLRFEASATEHIQGSTAQAWAWVDRLPEALAEFPFVREVRSGASPERFSLLLGPVGYGKVSMSLDVEMRVSKDRGRSLRLQSVPGCGSADAAVSVQVEPTASSEGCRLCISLDVSPHAPAAAFWPREWIEKASSASLQLAARKMLRDMKVAIEGGAAERLSQDGSGGTDAAEMASG